MIEIQNLTVGYKNRTILHDISLSVGSSKVLGLVAPNGTGKTTFFRTMSNLNTPSKGEIMINGTSFKSNRAEYLSNLFYMESSNFLYSSLNAINHLQYVKRHWQSAVNITQVVKQLNMENYIKMPIKKMSLGMKQHVLIAMCIVSDAEVILLDEPMNGLDPSSQRKVSGLMKTMKDNGKTIILSSHDLHNINEISDMVIFMKDKKFKIIENSESNNLQEFYTELFIDKVGGN